MHISNTVQPLKITFLAEAGDPDLFADARALAGRGHEVVCVVPAFHGDQIPESDVVIGIGQSTILAVLESGRGRPVHLCRAYEGDRIENHSELANIEAIYRMPGIAHIAGSKTLARRLVHLFGLNPLQVPIGYDEAAFRLHAQIRRRPQPVRVGISGSFESMDSAIAIGITACRLATRIGVDIELVRISPDPVSRYERDSWGCLSVEWHESPTPDERNVILAGLDLFVGSDRRATHPLAALEAMASGAPCILTDISEFRDLCEGDASAELVTAGDHDAIARVIVALTKNSERRAALARRALEAANRFAFARRIDAFEKVLYTLAEQVRGASDAWSNGTWNDAARLHSHLVRQIALCRKVGDYNGAIARARAAVQLHPSSADCRAQLAVSLFAAGRTAGAIAAAERALEDAPHSPALHDFLGNAYAELGDHRAARTRFTAAIENGIPGTRPHLEIARTLVRENRIDEAIVAVENCDDDLDDEGSELMSQLLAMRSRADNAAVRR